MLRSRSASSAWSSSARISCSHRPLPVGRNQGLDESGKSVPPLANADLPHVVLQIPVFNEPRVVEGALRAACALDWPRDRLHIQLLDDSTDETTERAAEIIAELRAAGNDVLRAPRGSLGFKAGACITGLRWTIRPLRRHARRRLPPAGRLAAQGHSRHRRRSEGRLRAGALRIRQLREELADPRVQGLILDAHFMIEQRTRANLGWLFQFNGTGGIWRRAAIDLGRRLARLFADRGSRPDHPHLPCRLARAASFPTLPSPARCRKACATGAPAAPLVERFHAGGDAHGRPGFGKRRGRWCSACRPSF